MDQCDILVFEQGDKIDCLLWAVFFKLKKKHTFLGYFLHG
jgi:hypothetical protein